MKKNKYILISAMIISSILLLLSLSQVSNTKADESEYMVDISTNPSEILFNVGNMKPGDWATSVLEVNNEGNLDFNFSVNSHQESGDLYLYNQFFLRVSDNEGTLYEGKLKDFVNFPLGTLAAGVSNPLKLMVELPYETGNEAQGKSTSFVFDFNAVGHEEQIPIDGQCFEPPFSNRNFSLQPKSTVPIKFHLRDSDGDLEKEFSQKVRLEVTGPSPNGGKIQYVFTQKN
ncbi:hypothetical protein, partial [Neobacillus vireti]|uniref:hypothetical protein n=1 Tax=Neobacillus vireti TaxID=220686 RepID=UPI002FFE9A92